MTTETNWFPLSFHNEICGKQIRLHNDLYGYQSIAEYTEVCHSLNDGLVAVEQALNIGDRVTVGS